MWSKQLEAEAFEFNATTKNSDTKKIVKFIGRISTLLTIKYKLKPKKSNSNTNIESTDSFESDENVDNEIPKKD